MGHTNLAEPDVEPVALGLLARLADRHDNPAPIGVLAATGSLDQRRIGDRHRDALGGLPGRRALDIDLDELSGALTVAHDLLGEIAQELVQRAAERGSARIVAVLDRR